MQKVILISGGTKGIGRAISEDLLRAGHQVATFCPFIEELGDFDAAVSSFCDAKNFLAIEGNVADEGSVAGVVKQVVSRFGRIDVLINNAGVLYYEECDRVDITRFKQMIDINLVGAAILTKEVVPFMKKEKGGQIINVVSTAGRQANTRAEFYAATKYGMMGYSQGIRAELRDYAIKVATVCPGVTNTDAILPAELAKRPDDKAMLEPAEVARAVKFIVEQPENSDIRELLITPTGSSRYHF